MHSVAASAMEFQVTAERLAETIRRTTHHFFASVLPCGLHHFPGGTPVPSLRLNQENSLACGPARMWLAQVIIAAVHPEQWKPTHQRACAQEYRCAILLR